MRTKYMAAHHYGGESIRERNLSNEAIHGEDIIESMVASLLPKIPAQVGDWFDSKDDSGRFPSYPFTDTIRKWSTPSGTLTITSSPTL
jgi:hypothetical protein